MKNEAWQFSHYFSVKKKTVYDIRIGFYRHICITVGLWKISIPVSQEKTYCAQNMHSMFTITQVTMYSSANVQHHSQLLLWSEKKKKSLQYMPVTIIMLLSNFMIHANDLYHFSSPNPTHTNTHNSEPDERCIWGLWVFFPQWLHKPLREGLEEQEQWILY